MKKLIGLTGKAGTGKSTVADYLVAEYGYTQVAFADPLREMLLRIDPTVDAQRGLREVVSTSGWDGAKNHPEVRRLLQATGQAVRKIDPDSWVRAMRDWLHDTDLPVVVSDVRYFNEAGLVRGEGGVIVRVESPYGAALSDEASAHSSEMEQEGIRADRTIFNVNQVLGDLHMDIDDMMRKGV